MQPMPPASVGYARKQTHITNSYCEGMCFTALFGEIGELSVSRQQIDPVRRPTTKLSGSVSTGEDYATCSFHRGKTDSDTVMDKSTV